MRLQLFSTRDVLNRWGAPNSFLLAPADAKVSIPIKVYQTTQQLSIKNQGNKIYLELWKPGYCWFSVWRHSKYWLASWHLGRVVEILFYISFGYCTQLERSYRNFQPSPSYRKLRYFRENSRWVPLNKYKLVVAKPVPNFMKEASLMAEKCQLMCFGTAWLWGRCNWHPFLFFKKN